MSYKETMREYWKSFYFQIGIVLMVMGLVLYNVIAIKILDSSWEQMLFWLNISTYALILPIIGVILCAYGYYKVIIKN